MNVESSEINIKLIFGTRTDPHVKYIRTIRDLPFNEKEVETKVELPVTRKKEHDNQDIHLMKGGLEQKVEAFHTEMRVKDSRLRSGKGIKEI